MQNRRIFGILFFFAGIFLVLAATTQEPQSIPQAHPSTPQTVEIDPKPIIVTVRETDKGRELLCAVWSDGTIILRSRERDTQSPLLVGHLGEGEVLELLGRISRAGFFESVPQASMPGMQLTFFLIRKTSTSDVTRRKWHENLRLLALPNQPAANDIAFAKSWNTTRGELSALVPSKLRLLDESLNASGSFRGYDPQKPWDTDWIY